MATTTHHIDTLNIGYRKHNVDRDDTSTKNNDNLINNLKKIILYGYLRENDISYKKIPIDLLILITKIIPSNILPTRKSFEFNVNDISKAVHNKLGIKSLEHINIIGIEFYFEMKCVATNKYYDFDTRLKCDININHDYDKTFAIKYVLDDEPQQIAQISADKFIDLYRERCRKKTVLIWDSKIKGQPDLPYKYCKFTGWIELDLNHNKQQWLTSNGIQDVVVLGKCNKQNLNTILGKRKIKQFQNDQEDDENLENIEPMTKRQRC